MSADVRPGPRSDRFTVSVPVEVGRTLRRLAAVEHRSISAVIAEVLGDLEPGFRTVAELGERFEAASESQRVALADAVEVTGDRIGRPLAEALAAFEELGGADRDGSVDPRASNTGVTLGGRKTKPVVKGKSRRGRDDAPNVVDLRPDHE